MILSYTESVEEHCVKWDDDAHLFRFNAFSNCNRITFFRLKNLFYNFFIKDSLEVVEKK